ncbi:hypothetical protein N7540_000987 [Penicillium herquei]|nr:hypothetical protein N7540_000987 [Penicillium herquei]
MASIYGNAQITIHAANCSTSDEGILATGVKKSHPIDWSNRFFKKGNARRSPKVFIREQTQDWVSMTRTSPLATRSWTLQERMLSKRSIFFGKDQIYWECNACIRCENNLLAVPDIEPRRLHTMSTKHHKESHRLYIQSIDRVSDVTGSYGLERYLSPRKLYHSPLNKARPKPGLVDRIQALNGQRDPDTSYVSPVEQRSMLEEWSAVVEAYSGRHLTEPSDKLPAMAGLMLDLAARYGVNNEEYAAGLWKNDIYDLRGLLWRVDASREQVKISRRYRALLVELGQTRWPSQYTNW